MIQVDDNNPTPPFEQIRSQLSAQIKTGVLTGGERLPSVRQLSQDLQVAPGTVARAYSMLEVEGVLETRRGAGTRVSPGQTVHPALTELAGEFATAARAQGLTREEAVLVLTAAWL